MSIFAGFVMGIVGSFHCIGMCGPIALALPVGSGKYKSLLQKLLYNFGRVITYMIMGGFLGLIGQKIELFGFQRYFSLFLGGIILFSLLLPVKFKGNFVFLPLYQFFDKNIKSRIAKLFNNNSSSSFLLIGILNGFLPCGLVYIALAGAISTGNIIDGVLFMMMFGLGTVPAMFVASVAGGFISLNVRKKMTKLIPVFTLFFALLFILRGLNLGIPMISPRMMQTQAESTEVDCCH